MQTLYLVLDLVTLKRELGMKAELSLLQLIYIPGDTYGH